MNTEKLISKLLEDCKDDLILLTDLKILAVKHGYYELGAELLKLERNSEKFIQVEAVKLDEDIKAWWYNESDKNVEK